MPIYRVQDPSGKIHRVEGPPGATPDQVLEYVRGTVGSELAKGAVRGAAQVAAGAAGTAQAVGDLGRLTTGSGLNPFAGPMGAAWSKLGSLGGDLADRIISSNAKAPALAQGNVIEDPSRLKNPAWWASGVGEGLGNLAASLTGARVFGAPTTLAGKLGFIGTQAAAETAPEYRNMLKDGMDLNEALGRAGAMAAGSTLLNAPGAFGMGDAAKPIFRRILDTIGKEVPTEYAEELWQSFVRGDIKTVGDLKDAASNATEVLLPAAVGGAAGAGLTGRGTGAPPPDPRAEAEFRARLGIPPGGAPPQGAPGASQPGLAPEDLQALTEGAAERRTARDALERRGREGDTQLGATPEIPALPPPPPPVDPEQARIEAIFGRRSMGETLTGSPDMVAPPAPAPAPAPELDLPMMDPSQGPLMPDGYRTPQPEPPTIPIPRPQTGAAMDPGEALAAAEQVRREQAALQASITRANRQPGMAPEEVAGMAAQADQELGRQPAMPPEAPTPGPALVPPGGSRAALAMAEQADQERAAQLEAERAAKWVKQPIQVRLPKDPALRSRLEQLRGEVGWLQQGGKASIHPDTWYDLPFAEAEKMRAKAGTTGWIPRSDWWRERPVKINEKDSLEAIDQALKGGKLKPNQRKFIDYVERVAREGEAAVLRADGIREGEPSFGGGNPQTRTPEFRNWFGESRVVDGKGEPLRVYHGTTADFESFDRMRANQESDFGAGFYFSSERDDVGANYAGVGPDLQNKIQREAELIAAYDSDRDYSDPDVQAEAREKFMRHDGMTMPVYLSLKNPAVIGGKGETQLTFETTFNEDGDPESESGTLLDFIQALRSVASDYQDGDVDPAIGEIMEYGVDGEVPLRRVVEILRESEEFGYFTDSEGELVSNEIIRRALEETGFDGIIDRTVNKKFGSEKRVGKPMEGMKPDTVHYIAFRPEQIKSAVGNSGAFDPQNPSVIAEAVAPVGGGITGRDTLGGVSSDNARSYGPGRRAPRSRGGGEPDRAYRLAVQRLGRDANLDDLEREAEKIRREGDGIDAAYAGKKAGEAGGQLSFDFETRPGTTPRQVAAGEAFIRGLVAMRDRRLGASVLADGLTRDFTGTGTASLIGRRITSFYDYGVAAQVFRDPRVENLRFHLVQGGVVVDEIYVSSRLPGAVQFTVGDAARRLTESMKATGADGYYIQHNHPSGNPIPSGAEEYAQSGGHDQRYDMGFTEQLAGLVPGFQAHVVVDNDRFTVISQKPVHNANTAEEKRAALLKTRGLLNVVTLNVPAGVQTYHTEKNPRVQHPGLGEKFNNATQVVEYVKKQAAPDEETVTLIATDSASKIKAIVNYPLRMLTGIDRGEMGAVARIRRLRAGAGAGFMVIAVARPKHEAALTRLMNLSLVQEAVIHDPGQVTRKVWASSASRSLGDKVKKPIGRVQSAAGVFDEPATPYQAAERPDRVDAGGGSYSMKQFGNLTDAELATLSGVMGQVEQKIEGERRGTRNWDATEEAALKLIQSKYGITLDQLVNRKRGSTANAEQLEAFAIMLSSASRAASAAADAYSRTNSNEDLAALMAARERLGVMLAPAMGYRTEAGRALNILAKTAADFRKADALFSALGDGTENAMRDFAKRVKQAGSPDQVIALTKNSYTPTLWDKFYEYWINGLLSGPMTHTTNIISNAWWALSELSAQAVATAVSRDASFQSLLARVGGMSHGITIGLKNAGQAFLTEQPQLTPETQLESDQRRAIGGRLGKVVRIPGRALMGEDEFFKAIAYHGELASLAMDEALKTDNPRKRFQEIMGGINGRPDLIEKARDAAVRATFQDKLGPILSNVNQGLIKSKVGKLIVPFVRTPTNILKRAIEYTPAGYSMQAVRDAISAGGKDEALAYSRMAIGSSLMLSAVGLAARGLLTGAGPDDPRERALWLRQGNQPYSVKIGNTWVRFSRIDPLATWLGVAGDMYEMSGAVGPNGLDADSLENIGAMAVTSLALNLGDKSFLRGISDFSSAYADPKRYLTRWATGLATSVIPNVVAQPTREADPYMREARNLLDQARGKLPGLRQQLAVKLDIAGEPIENPGGKFVLPFNTATPRDDRLAATMLELGVFKGKPGRTLSMKGASVEMDDATYNDYVEFIQKSRYQALMPLVSSPQFQQVKQQNPLLAGQLLERQWDQIGTKGRAMFLASRPQLLMQLATARQSKTVDPSAYVTP